MLMTTTSRRGWAVTPKRGQRERDRQRMAILCGFVLLLVPSWTSSQQPPKPAPATVTPAKQQAPPVIIGESYDPKTVAAAEARIRDDSALVDAAKKGKAYQLNVGEFEVFHPKLDANGKPIVTSPVTWLAINVNCARKIEIPAGAEFIFVGRRKGALEEELHEFKPEKFTWWVVIGRQVGMTPLVLVQNGQDPTKNPPSVVDRFDLTVGKPAPGPVDPVDPPPGPTDPFVIAAQNDVKAGRGTADDVKWYREYFRAASISEGLNPKLDPNTGKPIRLLFPTAYDFYDAFDNEIHSRLGAAVDANKNPNPAAKLPSLRRLVGDELNRAVTKNNISFEDPANRRMVAEAWAKIAEHLKGYQ